MNDLPTVVRWSEEQSMSNSLFIETCRSVIDTTSLAEANDYTKSPVIVTNIDLPIVVDRPFAVIQKSG